MPNILYVISDLQFDGACDDNDKTNFEVIKQKYKNAGYSMPRLCFWQVCARDNQVPVTKDENGTMLVSGCSPSIFNQVVANVVKTPYEFMLETINAKRYDTVVYRQ